MEAFFFLGVVVRSYRYACPPAVAPGTRVREGCTLSAGQSPRPIGREKRRLANYRLIRHTERRSITPGDLGNQTFNSGMKSLS